MNIESGPLRQTVLTMAAVALLSSACVPDVGPTAVDVQFAKGGKGGGPKEDPDPPPPVYSEYWEAAHDIGYRADDGAWILIASDQSVPLDPFRMDPTLTGEFGVGPTWTPNGDLLIWGDDEVSVIRQGSNGISSEWLFDVTQSGGIPPVWSPNGKMIAFLMRPTGSDGETSELFVQSMNLDGTATNDPLRQVSHEPDRDKRSARWGPYSERIATLDDQNNEIVIYDVTKQQPDDDPRVLVLPGGIHLFEWARTKDRLVTFSGGNIWIIDFSDPNALTYCNLTSGTSLGAWDPTWSPDDKYVLFGRKRSAKRKSRAHDLVMVRVLDVGRSGAGCNDNLDWYEETILVEAPDGRDVGFFVQFTDWSRWSDWVMEN